MKLARLCAFYSPVPCQPFDVHIVYFTYDLTRLKNSKSLQKSSRSVCLSVCNKLFGIISIAILTFRKWYSNPPVFVLPATYPPTRHEYDESERTQTVMYAFKMCILSLDSESPALRFCVFSFLHPPQPFYTRIHCWMECSRFTGEARDFSLKRLNRKYGDLPQGSRKQISPDWGQ